MLWNCAYKSKKLIYELKKSINLFFEMFRIVIASFQISDKFKKSQFFWITFLSTNNNIEIILKIRFLSFNNINVAFVDCKFIQSFYITINGLPTI